MTTQPATDDLIDGPAAASTRSSRSTSSAGS